MSNKSVRPHRRNDFPIEDFQGWTKEYLVSNNYITRGMMPVNVSAFHNDSGYISVMPFIPTKLSQLINDPGFISTAPVLSVNGQTGAVVLALFSGAYTDLTGKPTIPTVRRAETFSGLTDASGNYTITYSSAYPAVPHVSPQLTAGTPSQTVRITSSTTTGFTVNVTNRASVTLLAVEVLLAATTPVVSAAVSVSVLARA